MLNTYQMTLTAYSNDKNAQVYKLTKIIRANDPTEAQIKLLNQRTKCGRDNVEVLPVIGGYEAEVNTGDITLRTSNVLRVIYKYENAY